MKLGNKTFEERVQAAFEGTKRALGNSFVQAATGNHANDEKAKGAEQSRRAAQTKKLAHKRGLVQLRRRLGVSTAQFAALQSSPSTWAAHSAKQATTLYDRATESTNKKSLLHHRGLERRAAQIAADLGQNNRPADVAAVRRQLTDELGDVVKKMGWSDERRQVVHNLAADLIKFSDRLPSEQATMLKSRGNFVQRFGKRSSNKASALADAAGNVVARAGDKAARAANTAVGKTYDVATSGVAAVIVGAGVTVVGAAMPLAMSSRLVWNAGAGVADGAKGIGRALKKAAQDGAAVTRTRNANDLDEVDRFFAPR